MIDKFISRLKEEAYLHAQKIFNTADQEEQVNMLARISSELNKKQNLAVESPNVLVVLNRKLKPGVTFKDFYEAWKPPAHVTKMSEHKNEYHYFNLPVRVIHAENASDPSDIITVCMIWGEKHQVETKFVSEMKPFEEREQSRQNKQEKISDFNFEATKYGIITSDD